MKFAPLLSALCLFSLCAAPTVAEEQKPAPAPNGLEIPEGFENWAVISIIGVVGHHLNTAIF